MNPLTQIKNTQKASQREIVEGISDKASWHARFKHSAYIYAGGFPYELTEGDLLAVFSQYGEIVDVNLVRDKKSGKSKGFAFLAYMDQRSTVLAVDNLSGARVGGRIVRVEHVDNYKKKKAELTGEPESESEEEGAGRGAGPSGVEAARWGHEGFDREQGRGGEGGGGGAAAAGVAGDEPWAASNSVFALLNQARGQGPALPLPGSRRGGGAGEEAEEGRRKESKKEKKKHKKEKKEKKEKKDKKKRAHSSDSDEGSDGDERGRGRSPAATGPAPQRAPEGARVGPPRPPPADRPAREEGPAAGGAGGGYGPPRPLRPAPEGSGRDRPRSRSPRRGDDRVREQERGYRSRSRSRGRNERGDYRRRRSPSPHRGSRREEGRGEYGRRRSRSR